MYLLKKSFRNNDLSLCSKPFGGPMRRVQTMLYRRPKPSRLMSRRPRRPVIGVNICDYFFPQGLVTWLDTPILSRTIQEVIDARQLV